MDFRVQLEIYRGPLELLLHLVRKHELSPVELPLGDIVSQYVDHLESQALDVNEVGDFIELATTLVEIKSRQVLPHAEEDDVGEAPLELPREDLVQRLLDYKIVRDAASVLDEKSRQWQLHYARLVDDLTPRRAETASQPIDELEVWDLVNAYGRFQFQASRSASATIVYDDTPMPIHMQRIWEMINDQVEIDFDLALSAGMLKASLIGMFLAVLELMRHQRICAQQDALGRGLRLLKGPRFHEGWNVLSDATAAA